MSSLLRTLLANQTFRQSYIDSHLRSVTKACRDTTAHLHAKELVPIGELLQDNTEIFEDEATFKDNLLPLVVNWFSSEFFRWFEAPNCERCSNNLTFFKSYVNKEGKQVEAYTCIEDLFEYIFVRHNEPAILLHTRTGRCGEWAMCFLIILRALDYHARIVYDSTDHCWNEVWSEPKQQFIHVDPCENTVDCPLLYEAGWRKELEYCFAIGQYEIEDVTKRYSLDFEKTLERRTRCEETWLSGCLDQITSELLALAPSDEVRSTISQRRSKDIQVIDELSKLPRQIPDKSQLSGRKTGSLQWRISRGEYKTSAKNCSVIRLEKLNESEPKNSSGVFTLTYNCDRNAYESTASDYNGLKNWSSLVYEYENLDFKYERDWKTSYIARFEGCPHYKIGLMRLRLDLREVIQLDWQSVEILVTGKLYPDTTISITLTGYLSEDCDSNTCNKELLLNHPNILTHDALGSATKYMDLLITMSGGSEHDDVAWQKPQLFRQTRGQNSDQPALSIRFY